VGTERKVVVGVKLVVADEEERDRTMESATLECRDVVVRYGAQRAVDGVSLAFAAGTVTGIIGPNGAGKSSLISVLAGSLRPDSGTLFLGGRNISRWSPTRRGRAGLVRTFQGARVFADLSVVDNLLAAVPDHRGDHFLSAMIGARSWQQQERREEERARRLLSEFGLTRLARERAGNLSGGQQKIVEYLRALMARPRVLLLDEPSSGLAPPIVEHLRADLERLASGGCCVIVIEHEMGLVQAVCERVVGMANGSVIVDGDFSTAVGNEYLQAAYIGRR
jgi:ABC-type branched-subunit amino acid transport system ATPase component